MKYKKVEKNKKKVEMKDILFERAENMRLNPTRSEKEFRNKLELKNKKFEIQKKRLFL